MFMPRALVVVLVTGGCFSQPPAPGSGGNDAAVMLPPPPGCQAATPSDDFGTVENNCGGWGSEAGTMYIANGYMQIEFNANSPSNASCTVGGYNFTHGAMIRVKQMAIGDGLDQIYLSASSATRWSATLVLDGANPSGQLLLADQNNRMTAMPVAYNQTTTSYLRLIPIDETTISADYSSDGNTWMRLDYLRDPNISTSQAVTLKVGAGTTSLTNGSLRVVQIDSLNVCP